MRDTRASLHESDVMVKNRGCEEGGPVRARAVNNIFLSRLFERETRARRENKRGGQDRKMQAG